MAFEGHVRLTQEGIRQVRVSHGIQAVFDDPNLLSAAGLVPVMALAERAGLYGLVAEHVSASKPGGCNAPVKVTSPVAGMVAGADSITDMDLLRHGGMGRVFTGVRTPPRAGFLRTFTRGHVRQLRAAATRLLGNPGLPRPVAARG